jgi:hypothetical protein
MVIMKSVSSEQVPKNINCIYEVEDLAAVNQSQIKIILPQPESCGQTKRQSGYI